MSYTVAGIKALVSNYDVEVSIISWDRDKLTPYVPPNLEGVTYYNRSSFSAQSLIDFSSSFAADIIYVSGWMDRGYLKAVKICKRNGAIIVCGLDNQWRASWKQYITTILSPLFHKTQFDYMWVCGLNQFLYANRLGYDKSRILTNLYSADVNFFSNIFLKNRLEKKAKFPHRLVYVGRFHERKGIDTLITSFKEISEEISHDWELVLIGSGPQQNKLELALVGITNVRIMDFMSHSQLANSLQDFGVYVIASTYEAWAVSIHEFAAAGFPLICSDECGATDEFLKSDINGFKFRSGEKESLKQAIYRIIGSSDDDLFTMGERSNQFSKHITSETYASSLMSVLRDNI